MAPLTEPERRDFWEICEDRYQVRSTILTSQLPVSRGHEQIGDPMLADGVLDRLFTTLTVSRCVAIRCVKTGEAGGVTSGLRVICRKQQTRLTISLVKIDFALTKSAFELAVFNARLDIRVRRFDEPAQHSGGFA